MQRLQFNIAFPLDIQVPVEILGKLDGPRMDRMGLITIYHRGAGGVEDFLLRSPEASEASSLNLKSPNPTCKLISSAGEASNEIRMRRGA